MRYIPGRGIETGFAALQPNGGLLTMQDATGKYIVPSSSNGPIVPFIQTHEGEVQLIEGDEIVYNEDGTIFVLPAAKKV